MLPGKATVHCSGPVGGSLMKGRRGRPSSQNLGLGRETINDRFSSGCDRRPSIAYLMANHSVRPRTAYLDTEYASGGSHARRPPTELMLIKWHGRVSLHMSYAVSCGHRRAGRVERGGVSQDADPGAREGPHNALRASPASPAAVFSALFCSFSHFVSTSRKHTVGNKLGLGLSVSWGAYRSKADGRCRRPERPPSLK